MVTLPPVSFVFGPRVKAGSLLAVVHLSSVRGCTWTAATVHTAVYMCMTCTVSISLEITLDCMLALFVFNIQARAQATCVV